MVEVGMWAVCSWREEGRRSRKKQRKSGGYRSRITPTNNLSNCFFNQTIVVKTNCSDLGPKKSIEKITRAFKSITKMH